MPENNGRVTTSVIPKAKQAAKNPFAYLLIALGLLGGAAGREVIITVGGSDSKQTAQSQSELQIQKFQTEQLKEVQGKQEKRIEKMEDIQAKQTNAITAINTNLKNQTEKLEDIKDRVENIQRRLPRRSTDSD